MPVTSFTLVYLHLLSKAILACLFICSRWWSNLCMIFYSNLLSCLYFMSPVNVWLYSPHLSLCFCHLTIKVYSIVRNTVTWWLMEEPSSECMGGSSVAVQDSLWTCCDSTDVEMWENGWGSNVNQAQWNLWTNTQLYFHEWSQLQNELSELVKPLNQEFQSMALLFRLWHETISLNHHQEIASQSTNLQ